MKHLHSDRNRNGETTHTHTYNNIFLTHSSKGKERTHTLMLLFRHSERLRDIQNRHEAHTHTWKFSQKRRESSLFTLVLSCCRKIRRGQVCLFFACVCLPGWGWQLGSSSFQSASVGAALAPSGQNLTPGCPTHRNTHKETHTHWVLNMHKIPPKQHAPISISFEVLWGNKCNQSRCYNVWDSQLAGRRTRSPAEQNRLIITVPSTSAGSCHRSRWL